MVHTLILVRHGKAVRFEESRTDKDRELTDHGERALRAWLPRAVGLIPQGEAIQVWSSPASRAWQTALVLQDACRHAGLETSREPVSIKALWEQDLAAFTKLLLESDAATICAVGHNPFIEEAVQRYTGSQISFATGAVAALSFDERAVGCPGAAHDVAQAAKGQAEPSSGRLPQARLLWFVQGPISQRWKALGSMERVLEEAAGVVLQRREAFITEPDDAETMHKFRVSIRTLRSLLAFVAPWQKSKQNAACQEGLRSIVRTTSRLREYDVLAAKARELEEASSELVSFCDDLAAQERARVYELIASPETAQALDRIAKQLAPLAWRTRVEAQGLSSGQVRQRFDALADKLDADIARLDISDALATHDVRKKAKRVRYNAERFEELLGEDAATIARGMEDRQDDLGALCDARVNIDIIDSLDTDGLPECAAQDLARLRAQSEAFLEQALGAWERSH